MAGAFSHSNAEIEEAMHRLAKDKNSDVFLVLTYVLNTQKENKALIDENAAQEKLIQLNMGRITRLEHELHEAKERLVKIESKQMAQNVIIQKYPEAEKEVTSDLVETFFKDELKLTDSISIDVAHRIGKPGPKPRPIVVRLTNRSDVGKVLKQGTELAGKDYSINLQVPNALRAAQSLLLKERKALKVSEPDAKISVRGDQLWKDSVKIKDLKEIRRLKPTDNYDIQEMAKTIHPKQTTVRTVMNSKFQAHYMKLNDMSEVNAALARINLDLNVAGATHNIWAARVGEEELVDDDGEWGGAMKIMDVLQEKDIENGIVVVTRWFGGVMLGQKRFDTIKSLAEQALSVK